MKGAIDYRFIVAININRFEDMWFDLLVQSCGESQEWPSTLLHQHRTNPPSLEQISSTVRNDRKRLFIDPANQSYVDVLEAHTGENGIFRCAVCAGTVGLDIADLGVDYRRSKWLSFQDVKTHLDQHLVRKVKDPRVRHLFLSAEHSRAPLDCTYEMFLFLCTYHQVSPGFVDLIFSFGSNNGIPKDFHHTHLVHEIYRNTSHACSIPEIGRSGYEMRIGYKLSAIEISDYNKKWTLRETATYHSLDLTNGRSFWVTIKANDLIRDRITEASCDPSGHLIGVPTTTEDALIVALNTHLINASWCVEGWRWYITSMEAEVRGIWDKITAAPIPAEETTLNPVPGLVRALSLPREDTPARLSSPLTALSLGGPMAPNARPGITKGSAANGLPVPPNVLSAEEERKTQVEQTMRRLEILKNFSLKEMQRLNFVSSKLRQAKMVMSLNRRILQELREAYQVLFEAPDFSAQVRNGCAAELHEFQRHIKSLERYLEAECLRAAALMNQMDDGKNMYSMILDAQNKELDKLFAMSSHDSSVRMEISSQRMEAVTNSMHDIALTTEKDTSSMHIITFFTLIFLPGTFLCSFLSTDIIGDSNASSSWAFDRDLFHLFLKICLPMMVCTIMIWVAYVWYKQQLRAKREERRVLEIC